MILLTILLTGLNFAAFFWFFRELLVKPWRGKVIEVMCVVCIFVNLGGALNGVVGLLT
jgi:hypothetical protein